MPLFSDFSSYKFFNRDLLQKIILQKNLPNKKISHIFAKLLGVLNIAFGWDYTLEPDMYNNSAGKRFWIFIVCKDFTKSRIPWAEKLINTMNTKHLHLSQFLSLLILLSSFSAYAADETSQSDTISHSLDEITVVSFYRANLRSGTTLSRDEITTQNRGQEPTSVIARMPSVFSNSDTGNEYGYSYIRIRGMDQSRINITLDWMPLNDGEDMGVYFSNLPDFLSSMHSIKVENNTSIANIGVAGYAGSGNFESVN